MKQILLTIFLLVTFFSSTFATHIVGGEMDIQVVKGQGEFTHQLNLNLYFDDINGNPGAIDRTLTVGFFRKRDNFLIDYVTLSLTNNNLISYTNPACVQSNAVRTRLLQYSVLLNLSPLDDPQGYYVVWERCCRNGVISNIQVPGDAGSTFYLEIPPVRVNGSNFTNSSPIFKTLTGDYICLNRPFTFEFGATDVDGDSLVYSLVTPLNGYSSKDPANTAPLPRGSSNYPLVSWGSGFDVRSVMSGPVPLRVNSRTGQLTVTVNKEGLYVFCVLTEEYRKGVKIGAVRRDFQLKAIDCPVNNAPKALFREKGKSGFYDPNTIINFKVGEKRCLTILETDPDLNQSINMRIVPINFKTTPTITPSSLQTSSSKDTLRAEVCFDECSESFDGKTLIFDVIASDNGCPQPLTTTLRMQVFIEPRPNEAPKVSTDLLNQKGESLIGKLLKFNVLGTDKDNDNITVTARGRGFTLSQAGMSFADASGIGKLTSPFSWTPVCDLTRKGDYIIDFILTDTRCGRNLKDSISVTLKAISPFSDAPEVKTSLLKNEIEVILDGTEPQPINFDVISTDINLDPLKLYAQPKGFDLKSVGMIWTDKDGVAKIVNPFAWKPDCSFLKGKEQAEYKIDFITEDNSCSPNRFDTTSVKITLKNKIANFDIFKPANVFTPNGDGKNDFFSLDLPENNCSEAFEYIEIFNRWGSSVYKTSDRNFKWTGGEFASGDYYYLIKFTVKEFKGWVSLIR
jgi:gliding motility-associated-like protein